MENLARYIIRASFSQDRMTYLPDETRVLYRSRGVEQACVQVKPGKLGG